jgi:hypothetical protein
MGINNESDEAKRLADRKATFHRAFVLNCHELLALGYDQMDVASFQAEEEPAITGELVKEIKCAIESPNAPVWAAHFEVLDDPPINSPGRRGKRRRRVDIEMLKTQPGKRPRLQFEAKRLCNGGSIAKYLGADGLQLFLKGEYAIDHDMAGMLGYVQVGDVHTWGEQIGKRINSDKTRYSVCCDGDFCRHAVASNLKHTYLSSHDRLAAGKPIAILHTLLLFN